MTHFGIISPPVSGHLNPFMALGRELQHRGHHVTFINMHDVGSKILAEGLDFLPIGLSDHPPGSLTQSVHRIGELSGFAALQFTINAIQKTTIMFCRDAPDVITSAKIDVLLVDQTEPAGGTIAEHLGLPFITICCALAINREPYVPPAFTPWDYHPFWWSMLRNQMGYFFFDYVTRSVRSVITDYRRQWNLPTHKSPDDSFSSLAQISQQPPSLDFPRRCLPENFFYSGPFRNSPRQTIPFPYEELTGQPLIYASLGTLQNTKTDLFYQIAAACQDLKVQLIISHGGSMDQDTIKALPGSPLVVPYAPQFELLKRASLTITHGGLNTVLDSLSHGVPLIIIPITYEQPAIAKRVKRLEAGEVIPLKALTVSNLRITIQKVLSSKTLRTNALKLSQEIHDLGGVRQAIRIIENLTNRDVA